MREYAAGRRDIDTPAAPWVSALATVAARWLAREDLDLLAGLLSQRAAVHDRLGRFDQACVDADAVDALGGDTLVRRSARLRAGVWRASAMRRSGHTAGALVAVEAIEVAPDIAPGDASLLANERGLTLMQLGRLDEAAAAFEHAGEVADRGGDLLRADAAEAARETNRAASAAAAWLNLGHVALVAADPTAAIRAYTSAKSEFHALRGAMPVVIWVGTTLARIGASLPVGQEDEPSPSDRPHDVALLALSAAAAVWARGEPGGDARLRAVVEVAKYAANTDLRVLGGYASGLLTAPSLTVPRFARARPRPPRRAAGRRERRTRT